MTDISTSRPEAPTFSTTDRDLRVECAFEENVMRMGIRLNNGDDHFLRLEFTKGFAGELRDFLNKHYAREEE